MARPQSRKNQKPSQGRDPAQHGQRRDSKARQSASRPGLQSQSVRPRRPPATPQGRVICGLHAVREALRVRPGSVRELALRSDYLRAHQLKELADLAHSSSVTVEPRPAGELDQWVSHNQGAIAVVTDSPKLDREQLQRTSPAMLIACDGLEDPMNLGAVLRSAWLLGASGVLVPKDRSVRLTPSACKVASGGAEHVPVVESENLPIEIEELKKLGFWAFGLSEKGSDQLHSRALPDKIIWILGAESSGLRVTVERVCDELIRLPQVSTGSSFNASVAAALAMGESARQHPRLIR